LLDRDLLVTTLAADGDTLGFGATEIGVDLRGFVAKFGLHLY